MSRSVVDDNVVGTGGTRFGRADSDSVEIGGVRAGIGIAGD